MSDEQVKKHPALQAFERELKLGTVDKAKADSFDKFRQKQDPQSPLRAECDLLWNQHLEQEKTRGGTPARAASIQDMGGARRPERRPQGGRGRHERGGGAQARGSGPQARGSGPEARGSNAAAADPNCLSAAFHNPYTFLPFPAQPPRRKEPTPLSIDEVERDRFTGTIEIEIRTCTPLLTCYSEPVAERNGHKRYRVLAIDNDVIVPATGVRGSLRSLLTIIVGGTLGYVDDEAWLCQGRDAKLGPRAEKAPDPNVPAQCFLAQVVKPGDRETPGRVKLGRTKLPYLADLQRAVGSDRLEQLRPRPGQRAPERWVNDEGTEVTDQRDSKHPWQLKLSGRPVNQRGRKREGMFLDDGPVIELPQALWAAYGGRNRHGDHPELGTGDLVWLEPTTPDLKGIRDAKDVKSLQWARWGRQGERLLDVVRQRHAPFLPDSFNPDGKVDEVTDLFGQVPREDIAQAERQGGGVGPAPAFAARVRTENLVFRDALSEGVEREVTLAPLAPPHPGCVAFYRAWDGTAARLDEIANHGLGLRGYKVYRASKEAGDQAPWRFSTQGVYGDGGELKDGLQRVNKTCDLVKPGQLGRLCIACRAMSLREMALLLAACSVDWRLGGGKPLGLGLCRPSRVQVVDEDGRTVWKLERTGDAAAPLPEALQALLSPQDAERLQAWQASQTPVKKLRYPRAVVENRNKKSRGGHAWFARHASPKKGGEGMARGLETFWVEGDLAKQAGADQVRAQALPIFDPSNAEQDLLYGHDLFSGEGEEFRRQGQDRRTLHRKLDPFDEQQHSRPSDRSGGSQGQSREKREQGRKKRRKDQ